MLSCARLHINILLKRNSTTAEQREQVCYRSGPTVTPIGAAKDDRSILVHVLQYLDRGLQ
jgi:hypothetical protein